MKNLSFVYWVVSIICCVLVFQSGCKQQADAAVQSPAVTKTETVQTQAEAVQDKSPAEPNAAEPNDAQPEIKLEAAMHDFGEIGIKTVNTCQFKFTNIGKGLLVIKNVKSTCGCTVPVLPKKDYAPGESGTVNVHFTAPDGVGDTVKHLYIQSNDKKKPDAELILKAKIIAKVKYEPQILKLSLKKQGAVSGPIKLNSTDGAQFSIKSIKSTADCVTIDFDPNKAAAEFVLQPKADSEKLRKLLNGEIAIELTHPQCDKVSIFFEALPLFNINPPMIMILKAKQGELITREVWILNNYNEPFEIESVSSLKAIAKLVSQEKVDNGYKLVVEINPPPPDTKIRIFSDTIFIKIKDGENLEVNCRGFFEKDSGKTK